MQQVIERPGPEDYSPDPEKLLKVALKVLVRARDALVTKDMSPLGSDAIYWASEATDHTRLALVALERKKEETCNKP